MSEPFIGQIMQVGFNFPPRGWSQCNGQLLAINSNTALFSLLGTTFGGDGRTTFGLPDLRGRISKHVGNGPGLANVVWGQRGGAENVTLVANNVPPHNHPVRGNTGDGDDTNPTGRFFGQSDSIDLYANAGTVDMGATGNNTNTSQAFEIRNPYLGIYHNIALVGLFPSRN